MATPGWYPDPSGQPQMFRYWDGQSWSDQLTSDPSSPPPGPAAPPAPSAPTQVPPSAYAQQHYDPYQGQPGQPAQPQPQPGQHGAGGDGGGYPATPGGPGGPSGGVGKRVAIIALAVLLLAALAAGGFFGVRALTDDDDNGSASDDSSTSASPTEDESESPTDDESESPSESPTESESPSETAPAGDPCTGGLPGTGGETSGSGEISGGDLTLPPVRGYDPLEPQIATTFAFADEVAAVGRQIEEQWIALYAVGGLPKANGYTDLAASVDQVITCMTESPNFYRGFSGRDDLERESIQVDGHDAYSVTSEIRVDDPEVQVEGDVARVVVVDTGDDEHLGLYVSVVPIGNQSLIDQQEAVTGQLQVDD